MNLLKNTATNVKTITTQEEGVRVVGRAMTPASNKDIKFVPIECSGPDGKRDGPIHLTPALPFVAMDYPSPEPTPTIEFVEMDFPRDYPSPEPTPMIEFVPMDYPPRLIEPEPSPIEFVAMNDPPRPIEPEPVEIELVPIPIQPQPRTRTRRKEMSIGERVHARHSSIASRVVRRRRRQQ